MKSSKEAPPGLPFLWVELLAERHYYNNPICSLRSCVSLMFRLVETCGKQGNEKCSETGWLV